MPKGKIRTMQDDLEQIRRGESVDQQEYKEEVKEEETQEMPETSTSSGAPQSSEQDGAPEPPKPPQPPKQEKNIEELLPLEEEEESRPQEKEEKDEVPESSTPSQPPSPEMPEEKGGEEKEGVEGEIFPEPEPEKEESSEEPPPASPPESSRPPTEEETAPPTPEEPSQAPEETLQASDTEKKSKFFNKKVIIIVSLAVFGAALAGGGIFFFTGDDGQPPSQLAGAGESCAEMQCAEGLECNENNVCEATQAEPSPPEPIVAIGSTYRLATITELSIFRIEQLFEQIEDTNFEPTSITYLPILYEPQTGESRYLDLYTFLDTLGIETPEGFQETVSEEFMLYVYGGGENERVLCQESLITEESCYGPRLGMVLQPKEGNNAEDLQNIANRWENMIGEGGFESLVLNDIADVPNEGDIMFKTVEYTSPEIENAPTIPVRYVNLPLPSYDNINPSSTAINFGVVNNLLIVATSKHSSYNMIDLILQQQ